MDVVAVDVVSHHAQESLELMYADWCLLQLVEYQEAEDMR